MTTNFVRKGTEFIKSAVQKDNNEEYEESLSLYTKGIQYLMTGLKYEKNKRVQSAIKEKVQKYLTRAEEIKTAHPSSTNKKKKKKKLKTYPTQQQIIKSINNANTETTHLIYGYIRTSEKVLNINYSIPNGIVNLCIVYYFIPITYSPDPSKYIVQLKPNINWDNIIGLTDAKQTCKECIIVPLKFPALFTNKRQQNILLYGPPGTGKSLLSKAVATIANVAYLEVSISDICSKYIFESEKLLRNIFTMARDKKPSLMVFDEIDSLYHSRGSYNGGFGRLNREFLVQMQGVHPDVSDNKLFMIGITNCPWNIEPSVRRRFSKRIYIPLPETESREGIFRLCVGDTVNNLCDQDYVNLGQISDGLSGGDINGMVRDAMMEPVRDLQNATHFKRVMNSDNDDYKLVVCNAMDDGAMEMGLMDIATNEQNKVFVEPLEIKHFERILEHYRRRASEEDIERFIQWTQEFGDEMEYLSEEV